MKGETNLVSVFFKQASRQSDRVLFQRRLKDSTLTWTWQETADQVQALALYLSHRSITSQQPCAIISENRPEWVFADLGVLTTSSHDVPLYPTSSADDILYCLNDARARFLFISNADQLDKIKKIEDRLQTLEEVITFDAVPSRLTRLKQKTFEEAIKEGKAIQKKSAPDWLFQAQRRITPETLASVIYTSGTTGIPKGVMLTHANFLFNVRSARYALTIRSTDVYLSFLPLNHVFERMAGLYLMLHQGAQITYLENIDTLAAQIPVVRPTVMCGVPRFYEKIYNGINEKVNRKGGLSKKIFTWALGVGYKRLSNLSQKKPGSLSQRFSERLAYLLVGKKIHAGLGGRLRYFVSGGAPLARRIAEFFFALGIQILEGYGLTETSPVISTNAAGTFRFGTVGKPIKDVEVRIAPDGEILTRGAHIMKGYLGKEEATRKVIDKDGWFATGDVGTIDPDGFLTITDRKKELIVTSGGKNISPQLIENLLKSDPVILQAHIHGNNRRYLSALIVSNPDELIRYAKKQGIGPQGVTELICNTHIQTWIAGHMSDRLKSLAPYQKIKYFKLMPEEFSQEKGELTPTLKLRRRVIDERYRKLIDEMYAEPPLGISVP